MPNTDHARALLRIAADHYGTEALAAAIPVKPRTFYRWLDGSRQPRDWSTILARVRAIVTDRRAELGLLVQALKAMEATA